MGKIYMRDWGKVLGTRLLGEQVREQIEETLARGETIILNFADVETTSPSFVDECVGKLFIHREETELRDKLVITEASPHTKSLLRRMIYERIKEKRSSELDRTPTPTLRTATPTYTNQL